MLCYRDMTFCESSTECANADGCHRNFSEAQADASLVWAKSFGLDYAPVAMSDFRTTCNKWEEKLNDN